jgi:hypothetical protein
VDDRAGRGVGLLITKSESGAAADDDVDLLVLPSSLGVALDDILPCLGRYKGVDSERGDVEVPPDGRPLEGAWPWNGRDFG